MISYHYGSSGCIESMWTMVAPLMVMSDSQGRDSCWLKEISMIMEVRWTLSRINLAIQHWYQYQWTYQHQIRMLEFMRRIFQIMRMRIRMWLRRIIWSSESLKLIFRITTHSNDLNSHWFHFVTDFFLLVGFEFWFHINLLEILNEILSQTVFL